MLLNCGVGRRLLRVPWTAKRLIQSILKEISPEYSLEGLMLKLKLQYFGHLMQRTDSLETPWCWKKWTAEGEGDDTGWDGWMASLTQRTWVWTSFGSWWWTGKPGMLQSMGLQSQIQLSNWAELNNYKIKDFCFKSYATDKFNKKLWPNMYDFTTYEIVFYTKIIFFL